MNAKENICDTMIISLYDNHEENNKYTLHAAEITRAIIYINKNAVKNPVLDDIARASYCSSRTLQRIFRTKLKKTPMQYLKAQKLIYAYHRLSNARSGQTVTRVALDCGFNHMGKFSADYKTFFGEYPSQTLLRRKR